METGVLLPLTTESNLFATKLCIGQFCISTCVLLMD